MLPLLKHRFTPRIFFTLVFELIALNLCLAGLVFARSANWVGWDHVEHKGWMALFALCTTLVIQFGLWFFGLYSRQVIYSGRRVLINFVGAFLFLSIMLFPVCYLFSLTGYPVFGVTLRFYVILLAAFLTVIAAERFLILRLFPESSHLGNVLILGTGECTARLIREARAHHGKTLHLVGLVGEHLSEVGKVIEQVPVIGCLGDLPRIAPERHVKTVILCLPYDHPELPLDYLVERKLSGLNVYDACVFYETVGQKMFLEKLDPFTLLFPEGYTMTRLKRLTKDVVEKALALCLLLLLFIPMGIMALLVRLTSAGPVIYRQRRVGKGGVVFTLYKFRTMREDAEKESGATWSRTRDPRVTPVGRWLRRTRLDELPQLMNILRGDMAFIGPRPERPEFVEKLKEQIPFYHHRHFVKPGLTGWAQVSFPYASSLEDAREKLRYDLYYVKHLSIFFDLVILAATLRAVVRGEGVI